MPARLFSCVSFRPCLDAPCCFENSPGPVTINGCRIHHDRKFAPSDEDFPGPEVCGAFLALSFVRMADPVSHDCAALQPGTGRCMPAQGCRRGLQRDANANPVTNGQLSMRAPATAADVAPRASPAFAVPSIRRQQHLPHAWRRTHRRCSGSRRCRPPRRVRGHRALRGYGGRARPSGSCRLR